MNIKDFKWFETAETDTAHTYGIVGFFIYSPSKKWLDAGVQFGDFLCSTSVTGDVNSREKIHQALAAPIGTELSIIRDGERKKVTL